MNLIKIGAIAFGVLSGISIGVGATMACNKVHEVEEERKTQCRMRRMKDGWKLTTAEKIKLSWPYFIPGIGFMAAAEFCIFKNISVSNSIIKKMNAGFKAGAECAKTTAEVTRAIAGPKKSNMIENEVIDRRIQKVLPSTNVQPDPDKVWCGVVWPNQTDDQLERSLYLTSVQRHEQNLNQVIRRALMKAKDNPDDEGMSLHDLYDGTSGKAISDDDMLIWTVNDMPTWHPGYSGDKNGVPIYGLVLDTSPEGRW